MVGLDVSCFRGIGSVRTQGESDSGTCESELLCHPGILVGLGDIIILTYARKGLNVNNA